MPTVVVRHSLMMPSRKQVEPTAKSMHQLARGSCSVGAIDKYYYVWNGEKNVGGTRGQA